MTHAKRTFSASNLWLPALLLLMGGGAVAGVLVFIYGLSLTNLTDTVPWGLWITIDLSAIALSAGAFLLSAAVYVLGLKAYQPVARTAVYIGLFGYTIALCTLLVDIGRPDRFWHSLVYWNPHSVLWEVTMCIVLYLSVLLLEALPIFGEAGWFRRRWPKISERLHGLHRLTPVLAVVGLCLSLLHQSSLGATYGVMIAHPIWYRPGIAVLFLVSAAAGGPALTVLATMLAGRFSGKAVVRDELLEPVARYIGFALLGYLYFRFWDAFAMTYTYQPGRAEALDVLTSGQFAGNFWVGEILLGAVIPCILLLTAKFRRNELLRMAALALVVGGLVAYRWDTNLIGQVVMAANLPQGITTLYTRYTPSLIEILVGLGVVAYGLFGFTLGVKYLNVVDHARGPEFSH
jgi:Ni/Fe-hydrogenase subunit HybB-like protein